MTTSITADEIRKQRQIYLEKQILTGEMLIEKIQNVIIGKSKAEVMDLTGDDQYTQINFLKWTSSAKFEALRNTFLETGIRSLVRQPMMFEEHKPRCGVAHVTFDMETMFLVITYGDDFFVTDPSEDSIKFAFDPRYTPPSTQKPEKEDCFCVIS